VWAPKDRLLATMPGGALQDVKTEVYNSLLTYANKANGEVTLSA
jgi:hypothetical protein